MNIHFSSLFLLCILQWEYQVGPSVGIEAGDHIWASRYILEVIHFAYFLVFIHIHTPWLDHLVQYNVLLRLCLLCGSCSWLYVQLNIKNFLFALRLIHCYYLCMLTWELLHLLSYQQTFIAHTCSSNSFLLF